MSVKIFSGKSFHKECNQLGVRSVINADVITSCSEKSTFGHVNGPLNLPKHSYLALS